MATRFPSNSQIPSLLDQIWCNRISNFQSGVVLTDFSDHCPNFILFSSNSKKSETGKTRITFREVNENNLYKFNCALQNFNWN